MHEYHAAQRLLETVLAELSKTGAKKLRSAKVALAELGDVKPEPLKMYFAEYSKGTLAEGARLDVNTTPAALRCAGCNETYPLEGLAAASVCRSCGGRVQRDAGMTLVSITAD